jgi:hypothetical protein
MTFGNIFSLAAAERMQIGLGTPSTMSILANTLGLLFFSSKGIRPASFRISLKGLMAVETYTIPEFTSPPISSQLT